MSASLAESLRDNEITESTLNGLLVFSIVTLILSITSLALRFWSRLVVPRASLGYTILYDLGHFVAKY